LFWFGLVLMCFVDLVKWNCSPLSVRYGAVPMITVVVVVVIVIIVVAYGRFESSKLVLQFL